MRSTDSLLTISALLALGHALTLDCSHIVAQGKSFNLKKLGGPHSVNDLKSRSLAPWQSNTTWTVDICTSLEIPSDKETKNYCDRGTNICGIKALWNNDTDPDGNEPLYEPISIAGTILKTGKTMEPKFVLLNKTDDRPGGLQVELNGGVHANRKQQAVIDFLCDEERTGNEGVESIGNTPKRAEEGDDEDDKNSLKFEHYDYENEKEPNVLKLTWRTKYVCENFEEDDDGDETRKSSWGFFTWFIVLLFLGVAAYLIFGSWLNYNKYGARGWDLLPHGDTIRDVPYIFKDFSRKVLDTFSGGGSRGGYSAV